MDICILNSGFGSRLKTYTEHMPKGMVPLDEKHSILSRQIEILERSGPHRYVITTGYRDGMIQDYLTQTAPNLDVTYKVNTRYDVTNYISSLELLSDSFYEEIVLLHGDLVFEESVAKDVLASRASVVVVDSTLPLPEKDFKARIRDGKVIEIGIQVFGPDCVACQPFYHLAKEDWNRWQSEIHAFCAEGNESVYAENALNMITMEVNLYPLDVKGRLCTEIDHEADLLHVRSLLE